MLTEKGDHLVARLVVVSQQVDAELVIDVFGDGFSLVVLLGSFDTIPAVLDALCDC